MKLIKICVILFIVFIIIMASVFTAAYFYLKKNGKDIVVRQLEAMTQKKITMGSLKLNMPLNIEIRDLNIEGLTRADYVSITPNISSFITGTIVIDDAVITGSEYTYEKTAQQAAELSTAFVPVVEKKIIPAAPQAGQKSVRKAPLRLLIRHISIKDGKLNFIDRSAADEGIRLTVKNIKLGLDNLYLFRQPVNTDFQLEGKIPWKDGREEGSIEAKGWVNLFKKDMQAEVRMSDIDGLYFYPYYAQWVDLEKTRIEGAKLNLTSNIKGEDNVATISCHLELTDIIFMAHPEGEEISKAEKIATTVLNIFRVMDKGKIAVDFTFRTKMNMPDFNFTEVKNAVEDKLAEGLKNNRFVGEDIVKIPVKFVGGTAKSIADISKAALSGTVFLGDGFRKAVTVAFDRRNNRKNSE